MIPYISCLRVRELLDEFYDGELTVQEQVSVESHLHSCRECSVATRDLALIGQSLRAVGAQRQPPATDQLAGMRAAVVERVQVELDQSLPRRVGRLFEDLHLVWSALGASVATLACVVVTTGVLQASQPEMPNSLAGIIAMLANPGSNENPVRADGRVSLPRALAENPFNQAVLPQADEEDAVFALAAVVTREGRVANLELLLSEYAGDVRNREAISALLSTVSRARFEPAQSGGSPVAVSMVWLLAHTTVKADGAVDAIPMPWRALDHMPVRPRPKATGTEGHLRGSLGAIA